MKIISNIVKIPHKYKIDYIKSILFGRSQNLAPLPWMNYEAIVYIEQTINKLPCVFEYGSGSSTLYWIEKCAQIVSIEHDESFFYNLQSKLADKAVYHLIAPQVQSVVANYSPADPDLFQSSDYRGYFFENYVKAIDLYPDGHFDVVVVDGRARPSCIKRALPKIRRGGMLVLDNSDRSYYTKLTSTMLNDWSLSIFRGPVRGLIHQEQTSIYIKP
jgi:hypothetical protein